MKCRIGFVSNSSSTSFSVLQDDADLILNDNETSKETTILHDILNNFSEEDQLKILKYVIESKSKAEAEDYVDFLVEG